MRNVINQKNSESLVAEFLAKGGRVTKCKNFTGSSNNKPKGSKSKGFVSDKEFQTGNRSTSVFQRQTERQQELANQMRGL